MLLKILGRVLGTIATILIFGIIRLVLFTSMLHPHARAGSAAAGGSQASDQGTGTLAAADHSSWIVFNTADPATGLRTRHARLTGSNAIPGAAASILELTRNASGQHAVLTVPVQDACASLDSLSVDFDKHTALLTAKPLPNAGQCQLELLDYNGVLQSLRDSDLLTVHPSKTITISFYVTGLAWD